MIYSIRANLCLGCAVDSAWEVLRVYTEKCILLENDTTISLYFRVKAVVLSRFLDTWDLTVCLTSWLINQLIMGFVSTSCVWVSISILGSSLAEKGFSAAGCSL